MNRTSKATYIALTITLSILGILGAGQGLYIDYYFTHYENKSDLGGFFFQPGKLYVFEGIIGISNESELYFIQGEYSFKIKDKLNCGPEGGKTIKIVAYRTQSWISSDWHVMRIVSGC